MKRIICILPLLLGACVSMPQTVLHDKQGHTIVCGGETSSYLPIAYAIDSGVDASCIGRAHAKGYRE